MHSIKFRSPRFQEILSSAPVVQTFMNKIILIYSSAVHIGPDLASMDWDKVQTSSSTVHSLHCLY